MFFFISVHKVTVFSVHNVAAFRRLSAAFLTCFENAPLLRLHRFLWEHKVARKVKVCKLLSQLCSCTLIMGTKSSNFCL